MIRRLGMAALSVSLLAGAAFAQNTGDDVKAAGKDVKREVKKGVNRVDETFCTGTKTQCAARKGRHRVTEAKDKAVDKVDQIEDQLEHPK